MVEGLIHQEGSLFGFLLLESKHAVPRRNLFREWHSCTSQGGTYLVALRRYYVNGIYILSYHFTFQLSFKMFILIFLKIIIPWIFVFVTSENTSISQLRGASWNTFTCSHMSPKYLVKKSEINFSLEPSYNEVINNSKFVTSH